MSGATPANTGAAVDRDNPWPGLASFTEEQSGFFHGRDEEIRSLARLMERKALTVLFGQSGLGKSSLLQAGVFPRLRAASFCPIYIRLAHAEGAPTPAEQVKTMVAVATARVGTWTKPGAAKPGESLWEFFHHRDDRLVDAEGRTIVPVLVFDQFEELFTLGAAAGAQRDRAVAFMSELAELVENRPSEKLVERLDQSSDEMDAFDFSRTDYRVCISLREDYLPHLEGLKTIMPALMENRMRLTRMTGTQALDAVLKPGGSLVTPEVARAIVEFVSGARGGSVERLAELDVEPPLLSVICRELNERRRALGQTLITADLVTGNRREILTDFYERSVADLPEEMRRFVEDKLLTKSGFRDNLALETALEEPGVTKPLIDTLVSRRLLRLEDRIGTQRVELTHDVLAEVIRASRDTRQQRLALEKERERERLTRRRMWLARTIAAGLLVVCAGVSWIAWRAVRAERAQAGLRIEEARLRREAEVQALAARRKAYASDMNAVQQALKIDNLGRAKELLNRQRPLPGQLDLRGWEWRYLWQFCQSDAREILAKGDDNSIASLSASADGEWLAAGSYAGGKLVLYNLRSRETIQVPAGQNRVKVAFAPRQPLLAIAVEGPAMATTQETAHAVAGTTQNQVRFWDASSRKVTHELTLSGECQGLSFSPDGEILAVAEMTANKVSLWRVKDGSKIAEWPHGVLTNAFLSTFATSPNFALAATAAKDSTQLTVFDLGTGQERWSYVADKVIASVAFSPDGKILATGFGLTASAIRFWDAATGRELGRLEGHRGWVGDLLFLADGRLVSSGADQTIRVWDLGTQKAVRTFRGHKTEVWRIALLTDGKTLVSGSKDGSIYYWDLENEARATTGGGVLRGADRGWEIMDDSRSIVTADGDGRVRKWSGRGFKDEQLLLKIVPRSLVRFSPSRPLLAYVTADHELEIWDWETGLLQRRIGGTPKMTGLRPLRFSDNGETIAATFFTKANYSYREWETTTGRLVKAHDFSLPPAHAGSVRQVVSPGGRTLVQIPYFAPADSVVMDLSTGEWKSFAMEFAEPAVQQEFSPDGASLVVTSRRGYVKLFDGSSFAEQATLRGYMFGVHSATFSRDGKRLATGSTGVEAMSVWDWVGRERLLTLEAPAGAFTTSAFSADGNVLAARGEGLVYYWMAPSWAEIEAAEREAKPVR